MYSRFGHYIPFSQSNNVLLHAGDYEYTKTGLTNKYIPELTTIYERPKPNNSRTTNGTPKKAVVFDVDETIGSFADLYDLWVQLGVQPNALNLQQVFNELLDLYPEFIRTGIYQILGFVWSKIRSGECHRIYIYTNNQCEYPHWVQMILKYLDTRMHIPVGDTMFASTPICAFKIRNKVFDTRRTTNTKTYNELIRCCLLAKNVEICYLDDMSHEHMKHSKVYFIQPPPYRHRLGREEIMDRFLGSTMRQTHFSGKFSGSMKPANTTRSIGSDSLVVVPTYPYASDIEISHRIMYYLREFFFMTHYRRGYTKKRHQYGGKFSRKKKRRHP